MRSVELAAKSRGVSWVNKCNDDFSPITTGSSAIVPKEKSFEWIFGVRSVNSGVTNPKQNQVDRGPSTKRNTLSHRS